MGISIELWRTSVGSFVMALKCKNKTQDVAAEVCVSDHTDLAIFLLVG